MQADVSKSVTFEEEKSVRIKNSLKKVLKIKKNRGQSLDLRTLHRIEQILKPHSQQQQRKPK